MSVGFTNGCFDVLHRGHFELLKYCKSLGLVVIGLNSDDSIKTLKGKNRPYFSQQDRKFMLESCKFVDEVIIFDEINPTKIRESVSPDVVVRGGEFTADEIRERDGINDNVIVKIFPIVGDKSTTNVIEKIKQNDRK